MRSDVDDLAALPENWDSYGAPRISTTAIDAARKLAECLSRPTFVPMGNGGVALEWHDCGIDLEIAIDPDGTVEEVCGECVQREAAENLLAAIAERKPEDAK